MGRKQLRAVPSDCFQYTTKGGQSGIFHHIEIENQSIDTCICTAYGLQTGKPVVACVIKRQLRKNNCQDTNSLLIGSSARVQKKTIERCTFGGESVKSVAEDIGYCPSLLYKWLRDSPKKGYIPSMKKPETDTSNNPLDIFSEEDLEAAKIQRIALSMR